MLCGAQIPLWFSLSSLPFSECSAAFCGPTVLEGALHGAVLVLVWGKRELLASHDGVGVPMQPGPKVSGEKQKCRNAAMFVRASVCSALGFRVLRVNDRTVSVSAPNNPCHLYAAAAR